MSETPSRDMSSTCFQCRRRAGQSRRSAGQAKGRQTAKAVIQRQKLHCHGGIMWATARATTKLPDQMTVASRASRVPVVASRIIYHLPSDCRTMSPGAGGHKL